MGTGNQYEADLKRLAELVSRYTGIPKTRVAAYVAENGASRLYTSSYSLIKTDEEFQKLSALFEFMGLYDNLRRNEKSLVINTSESAREYFKNFYADKLDKEYFSAAFLDLQCNVVKSQIITEGTLDEAPVYPREILKTALFVNANSVIVSHNHPGRTAKPSLSDIEATRAIAKNLNAADITLDDHIIIAGLRAISLAECGINMGDKRSYFKVSETDISRQRPAAKKTSARRQLAADKELIAKERAEPSKITTMAKKSTNLEI